MTPFSLVFRAEAVLPAEIVVPSSHISLASQDEDVDTRMKDLEAIDERRAMT